MLTSLGKKAETAEEHAVIERINFASFLTKPIKQSHLFNVLNEVFVGKLIRVAEKKETVFDATLGQKNPLRVLLAEDNLVNQKVALKIFEKLGYRVDVVSNGLEVIQSVARQQYDVIFMDVQMPEMDGLETTQEIIKKWHQDRPRIIAMTAEAMKGDKEKCIKAGMDDYILITKWFSD
jgi:CheY-like chemotaxis protein